jgi:predicted dehydrogenase
LQDPTINTVAILTRHNSHSNLVVEALQKGKNVFVEKPLALNQTQLDQVIEAINSAKQGILTVGYNRRFAPLVQKLRAFFANRIEPFYIHYRVNAGYLPLNHWTHDPELGGGRIIGEGCHFIDLLTSLVGTPPVSVNATALPNNGKYNDDNVTMTFTFADGSIGVVDYLANGDKSFSKEYIEVFCGGKIAILDDYATLQIVHNGSHSTEKSGFKQDKGHKNEMVEFAKAIKLGIPPIPYADLIAVTKASFAVIDSLKQNGAKITL